MKSRSRVKSYGEVFTPRYIVEKMLDLVSEELETGTGFVDKTFLEPAAGDGNFLVAILRRKLCAIEKRYPVEERTQESLFALASIYGIELLEDNCREAKAIMLAEFVGFHQACGVPCAPRNTLHRAAAFLIDTNVICGNTLTGRTSDGEDIKFSWWRRVARGEGMVQREQFTLGSLREENLDLFGFTACDSYQVCRIDQVHNEVKVDV